MLSAVSELIADINAVPSGSGVSPLYLTVAGDTLFFSADTPDHGRELWQSDGTEAGTVMVKDISPGSRHSFPEQLTAIGDTLYFVADDGVNGERLWRSDGTAIGTYVVRDDVSSLGNLLNFDGTLFFSGATRFGNELWKSDGTAAGTVMVRDIATGRSSGRPADFTEFNGALYFIADDGDGEAMWKTDGSEDGTVAIFSISPTNSGGGNVVATSDHLFILAHDRESGREVWVSDGTEAGTMLLKDIREGSASSEPQQLTVMDDRVFFLADDGTNPDQLWMSDGTADGTNRIPVSTHLNDIEGMTATGGILYFSASTAEHGQELWQTDGTSAGTTLVEDFRSGRFGSFPRQLTNINGDLYFSISLPGSGERQLWKIDGGTGGTVPAYEPTVSLGYPTAFRDEVYFAAGTIRATAGTIESGRIVFSRTSTENSWSTEQVVWGDSLFFSADDGVHGRELWKSNGQPGGTSLLKDVNVGSSNTDSDPRELTVSGDKLFFTADVSSSRRSLWVSDGTEAGTNLVTIPAIADLFVYGLHDVDGTLYFATSNGPFKSDLWKTDGTAAGTILVRQLDSTIGRTYPHPAASINGRLFFLAGGLHDIEVWVSDGTEAGTFRMRDIREGGLGPVPREFTVVGDSLFFTADDGIHGREIWRTDGTPEGTVLFDVRAGDDDSDPAELTAVGDTLFFRANDGIRGDELWKIAPGATEAELAVDLFIGRNPSTPRDLTELNGSLYFATTMDGTPVLWRSDGTPGGTNPVLTVDPTGPLPLLSHITAGTDRLAFFVDDRLHGAELWVSDGTAAGTEVVRTPEGIRGTRSSTNIFPVGDEIWFVADSNEYGVELFRIGDQPGLEFDRSRIDVSETGTSASLHVSLDTQPAGNVTVLVSLTDESEAAIDVNRLVFTSQSWNVPQTLIITGVDDNIVDRIQSSTVNFAIDDANSDAAFHDSYSRAVDIFTHDDEAFAPTVTEPTGVTDGQGLHALWTTIPEALRYEVWLAQESGASNPLLNVFRTQNVLDSDVNLPIGRYRLWVRAELADGFSEWGSKSFDVNLPTVLHEPEGPKTGGRKPLLSWAPVDGATSYRVYVSNVTTGQTGLINTVVAGTSYRIPHDLDYGRHRYWVRAISLGGYESQWSSSKSYDVSLQPTSPIGATLSTTPVFRWQPLPGATTYGIFVSGPGGVLINESNITSETFTPSTPLPVGDLRWWVRGFTVSDTAGPWSPIAKFSTGGRTRVETIEIDSVGAALGWPNVPEALSYEVYLGKSGISGAVYRIAGLTDSVLPRLPLISGEYTAWVRTTQADGSKVWGAGSRFTIDSPAHSFSPETIFANSSFDGDINLSWHPVNGALGYDVYVRNNAATLTADADRSIVVSDVQDTTVSIPNAPTGEWTWWVRPRFDNSDLGEWSAGRPVNTNGRVTDVAVLLGSNNVFTFNWGPVLGAVRYALQINNLTTGEANTFREDDIPDATFTTSTPLTAGSYRIWVRAISGNNDFGPWSLQRDFVVS